MYNAGLSQGQGTVWNLSCTGWRLSVDLPRCRRAHRIGIEQDAKPHSGITGIRGDGAPRHVAIGRQGGRQVPVRHEGGQVVHRQPLPQRRGRQEDLVMLVGAQLSFRHRMAY